MVRKFRENINFFSRRMCETKFSLILIQEQLIVGFLCVAHVVYCCCVENSNFCSRSYPARAERVNRKSIRDEDMWGKFRCLFLPLRPRLLLLVVGVAKKLWKKLKNLVAHHTRLKQTRVCLCVLRRFGWKNSQCPYWSAGFCLCTHEWRDSVGSESIIIEKNRWLVFRCWWTHFLTHKSVRTHWRGRKNRREKKGKREWKLCVWSWCFRKSPPSSVV